MNRYSFLLIILFALMNMTCSKEAYVDNSGFEDYVPTVLLDHTKDLNTMDESEILMVDSNTVVMMNTPEIENIQVGEILFRYPKNTEVLQNGILGRVISKQEDNGKVAFEIEQVRLKEAFESYSHTIHYDSGFNRSECASTFDQNNLPPGVTLEEFQNQISDFVTDIPLEFSHKIKIGQSGSNLNVEFEVKATMKTCYETKHQLIDGKEIILSVNQEYDLKLELKPKPLNFTVDKPFPAYTKTPKHKPNFYRKSFLPNFPGQLGIRGYFKLNGALEILPLTIPLRVKTKDLVYNVDTQAFEDEIQVLEFEYPEEFTDFFQSLAKVQLTFTLLGGIEACIGFSFNKLIPLNIFGDAELGIYLCPEIDAISKSKLSVSLDTETSTIKKKASTEFGLGFNILVYLGNTQYQFFNLIQALIPTLHKPIDDNDLTSASVGIYAKIKKWDITFEDCEKFSPELNYISHDASSITYEMQANANGNPDITQYSISITSGQGILDGYQEEYVIGNTYTIVVPNLNSSILFKAIDESLSIGTDCSTSANIMALDTPFSCMESVDHAGKSYCIQTFGTKTWMLQNLDFDGAGDLGISVAEGGTDYGRFYFVDEVTDALCPEGYRIPSQNDYENLFNILSQNGDDLNFKLRGPGWGEIFSPNGVRILPTGYLINPNLNSSYNYIDNGETALLWTIDDQLTNVDGTLKYSHTALKFINFDEPLFPYFSEGIAFPCRCVKD